MKDSDGNSPKKRQSSKGRFNDVTFINWSLSTEQKAAVKAWQPDIEELDDLLAEVVQEHCKITYGYDDFGQCFTCSFVPQPKHKTNYGYILVGRGSTPTKAFKQALYIHRSIFAGDWSSYSTANRHEELDD